MINIKKFTFFQRLISALCGFIFLMSCQGGLSTPMNISSNRTNDSLTDPNLVEPITDAELIKDARALWEEKSVSYKSWTSHVSTQLDILGQDLLQVIPEDSALLCPNYINLKESARKAYWIHMISAMVRFESNFNTKSTFQESFNDSNGNPVISRGLLQISIESSKGYSCGFKQDSELHDPLKNLSCGIRILNKWLAADGRLAGFSSGKWLGGARYWSVLREGNKASYQTILALSQNLKMCQLQL